MLQVGEIGLVKVNDPVHLFYLLYIPKEQGSITEIVIDIMTTSAIQEVNLSLKNI